MKSQLEVGHVDKTSNDVPESLNAVVARLVAEIVRYATWNKRYNEDQGVARTVRIAHSRKRLRTDPSNRTRSTILDLIRFRYLFQCK